MQNYIVNRPDEAALRRLLDRCDLTAAGAILRLAWLQGLMREELTQLRWTQVDFVSNELLLPDRTVPLAEEMVPYLDRLFQQNASFGPFVVVSDRDHTPMAPQSLSRLIRKALDSEGQLKVRLLDLRHDFIIRQLETHDWQYVSRISGVESAALQQHFSPYTKQQSLNIRSRRNLQNQDGINEVQLQKLIRQRKYSAAGIAIWLAWQYDFTLRELVVLRWDQIDFFQSTIRVGEQDTPLSGALYTELYRRFSQDAGNSEYVICSPKSKKPLDVSRLSKLIRTALVDVGLDDLSFRDFYKERSLSEPRSKLLAYVREKGTISRSQAMALLAVSSGTAYRLLHQLSQEGRLVRVGMKYYLPDAVVAPELHKETIRVYLLREGGAYRQDIAQLLRITPAQCSVILKHLVSEGDLVHDRQRYYLKDA